ncbi:MAG: cation:proton antiporter [Gammaproteobacteria bacterium]|nr:cation:proton antiporter [Gammaproteobacteria bacterium]
MTLAAEPGLVVAVLASLLVLLGATVTLVGALGLLRLSSFYERVHASTMGTTLGMASVLLASMLLFSALGTRPVLRELVIIVFMTVSTPIGFVLLVRAARHRDAAVGREPEVVTTGTPGGTDRDGPDAPLE